MKRNHAVVTTVTAVAAMLLSVGVASAGWGASGAAAPSTPAAHGGRWRGPGQPDRGSRGGSHRLSHVFIIMEENHAKDHMIGDVNPATGALSMPFLTAMAQEYGQATQYYGVTHTSEPNYIAATSGSTWWVNNDNGWYNSSTKNGMTLPPNHYDHTNIVDELDAAHIPWAAYMQAMPTPAYLPDSGNGGLYLSKHNPFILYNDIRMNPSVRNNIKPYADMKSDLNSGHAPRYVWITPDICNDLHLGVDTKGPVTGTVNGNPVVFHESPCPYPNTMGDAIDEASKTVADDFIKQAVTTITHSRAWTGNSVIFITADENDYDAAHPDNNFYLTTAGCCDSPMVPKGDPEISPNWPGGLYGGGLIPMVVISRHGPRHSTDNTAYNHYSMLLTIEQGFGLGTLGYTSDAAQVTPMWPLIVRDRH